MDAIAEARGRIKGRGLRIVLPEGEDERIRETARQLKQEKLAEPLTLDGALGPPSAGEIAAVLRQRPQMSEALAVRLLRKPLFRAGAMVASGGAAAMLAGAANPTPCVIEAALMTIGLSPGITTPSSFYLIEWPHRRLVFADCTVNIQPDAGALADIALASAASARRVLDDEPRVALLSFATHGGAHPDAVKVAKARDLARARDPDLRVDGGLQADAALNAAIAAKKVRQPSAVAGNANVLVFPDLDAGNISYKLLQQLSGARVIGPILQGFAGPVSDLSRGAPVDDIVATAALLLGMALAA